MPTRTCEKAGGGEKGREGKGTTEGARYLRNHERSSADLAAAARFSIGRIVGRVLSRVGVASLPPPPPPNPWLSALPTHFPFIICPSLACSARFVHRNRISLAGPCLSFESRFLPPPWIVYHLFFFFSFFLHVFFPTRLFLGELVLGGNFWKRYLRYKRGEEEGFIIPLSRFDNSLSSLPNPWNERNRTWREQGK